MPNASFMWALYGNRTVLQYLALPSTSFDATGHRSRHSLVDASRSAFT
jgi:hypothetical protein